MILKELYEAQANGVFKVKFDEATGTVTMGGQPVPVEQLHKFIKIAGWIQYQQPVHEIFDKTNKFVSNFKKHIKEPEIVNFADVQFQNFRRSDTMNYYDRIVIKHPKMNLTVLYHMPGVGGTYAVFLPGNHTQANFACRTMKDLCEFINECYGFGTEEEED